MNPPPLDDATRARMRGQRSCDTGPEVALRRQLRSLGVTGYRVGWRLPLPGRRTADVAFPGRRLAVFVDGCFWHSCPTHGRRPTHNAAWWEAKLRRNRERDQATDRALAGQGWTVLRVWEHENPAAVALLVRRLTGVQINTP